jgi:cobyrinic acid a,c-diamide synthase
VLVGEELVAPLLLHGARGCDVAVVEGVMGLFDGRGSTGEGSTAHVAHLLGAPVLLVVDASSQSSSVAALVHGFRTFDPDLDVAGVILNRVATDRHEGMLRDALDGMVPVVGVLRRDVQVETPSRHLGLVPVAERHPDALATVQRLGEIVADGIDLDQVLRIASAAGDLDAVPWEPPVIERAERPVVAVAGGPAFTFAYAETTEALTAAGAEVVVVDPLHDERLPEGTAGLVLPGGFPEVYVEQLAANRGFLDAVRAHLAAPGTTTYAECAGLLLLGKSLDGVAMVGHVDCTATMTSRLTLGYRTAVATHDNLIGPAGTVVVGHEFHRTATDPGSGRRPAWQLEDGTTEGFTSGTSVLASYLHLHPAGVPALAPSIVDQATGGSGCT